MKYKDQTPRTAIDQLPYFLRARALDHKLEPHELGRALYHLAQRRGFKSNRKAPPKKDERPSEVKEAIAQLERDIAAAGARTLGAYFATLDPEQQRIRGRWTARKMHEDEFEAIWSAQCSHHPDRLTDELKAAVHDAIFFQRPLKNQKHLIGRCSLEPGARRACWGLPIAQRFRLVQRVNDLELVHTDTGELRPLHPDERSKLLDALETNGDMTFAEIRKLLGLKKCKFNLEEGGEKKLPGNRTNAAAIAVFGKERWFSFSEAERDAVVRDLLSIEDPEALARRGREAWGLDPEAAQHFAHISIETQRAGLSTKAMRKLLPLMEQGLHYAEARRQVYGETVLRTEILDTLPPVGEALPTLRNPAVARGLAELRKVINALVAKYGKPAIVRIELARDLKKSRNDRKEIWERNRQNEAARQKAKSRVLAEAGLEPRGHDIEKVLLAEECGWVCPYTGRHFSMKELVGPQPQYDIEHIIPLSRCFDNSFFNKTLCYHEENRNRKRGRTPFEAYGADAEQYQAILERVRKFQGAAAREKLRRFQLESVEEFDDFENRQLNDTRYVSRLAADYVALLYGGRIDANGRLRVQVSKGGTTKYLRDEWDLNRILGDGGEKTRTDHRHHAVDAICIALTSPATVKMLGDAAARAEATGTRRFAPLAPPWPGFLDDVRRTVQRIVVSHRPDRKVRGALHEETNYSREISYTDEDGKVRKERHVRKRLEALSTAEVERIVDAKVREAVKAKLGANDPKKFFADPKNHPCLKVKKEAKDGKTHRQEIPIHKVRIRVAAQPITIGKGPGQRHVLTGSNHHVEIFEVTDKKGRVKWDGEIVTMLEAVRRKQAGEPVVRRDHGPGKEFVFSLCGGDTVEIDEGDGNRAIYVVRVIARADQRSTHYIQLRLAHINDARRIQDMRASGDLKRPLLDPLRQLHAAKVVVTPLGEVRRAHD